MTRKLLASLAVTSFLVALSLSASAATTLKIGTLAPADSPWGREFKKWANTVATETNGELTLDFQWNGQAGDEVLMVQKIRSGQLDGAAVTAVGLAQTGVTDVLLFQLPGLFANWGKLDAARNAVKDELNKQFESKGFTIGGWGDVGAAKTMSVGFEVHHPADLQGKCVLLPDRRPRAARASSRPSAASPPSSSASPRSCRTSRAAPSTSSSRRLSPPSSSSGRRASPTSARRRPASSSARWSSRRPSSRPFPRSSGSSCKPAATRCRAGSRTPSGTTTPRRSRASRPRRRPTSSTEAEKKEWSDLFAKVRQQLRGTAFSPPCSTRSRSWRGSVQEPLPVALLEEGADGRHRAQHGERVLGVAVRVAVADEEVDVLADALGAERGLGEARRHREEVDDAAVARRRGWRRSRRRGRSRTRSATSASRPPVASRTARAHGDRIARVGRDDRVADAERAELVGRARARSRRRRRAPPGPPRRRASAAQRMPLLPPAPRTTTTAARLHEARDLRRGARDVERPRARAAPGRSPGSLA